MTRETVQKLKELIENYDKENLTSTKSASRRILAAEKLADFISNRKPAIIAALELTTK